MCSSEIPLLSLDHGQSCPPDVMAGTWLNSGSGEGKHYTFPHGIWHEIFTFDNGSIGIIDKMLSHNIGTFIVMDRCICMKHWNMEQGNYK